MNTMPTPTVRLVTDNAFLGSLAGLASIYYTKLAIVLGWFQLGSKSMADKACLLSGPDSEVHGLQHALLF